MLSFIYALFPLAGIFIFVRMARKVSRERKEAQRSIPLSSWAWAACSVLMLVVVAGWGLSGLIEGTFTCLAAPIASAAMTASAYVSLRRDEVWDWYDAQDNRLRRRLGLGLVLLVMLLSALTIEVPFNNRMPFGGPSYLWLETLLCGLLLLALYLLGQRHAALCIPGVLFFMVTGIGQHYVKRFKNAAILPTDLLVLNTAAAVTKEYVFTFNEQTLMGLACTCATIAALSLARPPRAKSQQGRLRMAALNLTGCAASGVLLAMLVLVPSYMYQLNVQMKYWYSIDYYQMQGFLPSFIAVTQDMPIRRPDGYSDEGAQRLMRTYAQAYHQDVATDDGRTRAKEQFEQVHPSVVVVMNESFADLSVYDGMHAGYKGPQFFKRGFKDALARGTLNVSVHGAGTCNTEFEFLTGNSLGFIGVGKYPYSIYDLSDVDALAAQFGSWGYHTCAIHPNYASNWNRNKVYPQMGFDEFLSIDDFGGTPDVAVDHQTPNEPHCEVFHSGVSDAATYDRMLQMLQEDDAPQFFFDVTMANHGSYNQYNIPKEYQQHYHVADYAGEETDDRLNEYLACMQKSDDDLKDFVERLRALDRPVVLVFFGDHQPSLSMSYNDYWYADEPADVHARRAFSSDYVVWANYDVRGRAQKGREDETSVDMLAAQTLDLIGAPVSEYQAALLAIRKVIPSLSASDYQGADREWYVPDADGEYGQAYHDLSLIEYLNFATRI